MAYGIYITSIATLLYFLPVACSINPFKDPGNSTNLFLAYFNAQEKMHKESALDDVSDSDNNTSHNAQHNEKMPSIKEEMLPIGRSPFHAKKKTPCSICYKSVTNIYHHMQIHTGKRRYVCPTCNHRTIQKSNLKTHIKRHHPNQEHQNLYIKEKHETHN